MRTLLASAGLALLLALASEPSVSAQEAPAWMKQTLPEQALKPLWEEYLAVMNPTGALDGKTKQLIALGVAAQIPCAYCVYAHTKGAKAAGATDAQIKEAIATAALVRFNSTVLNGSDGGLEWQPQRKGGAPRAQYNWSAETAVSPRHERLTSRDGCPLWVVLRRSGFRRLPAGADLL